MKRTAILKIIALCIICTCLCNTIVLAVEPSTAGTIGKITEDVSAKLTDLASNEKFLSMYTS